MHDLNLNDVLVFVRVAETGSFSAAAAALRTGKSTVSRAIARLEAALATQLLQRDARATVLTEAGEHYLAHVAKPLADVLDASTQIQSDQAIRGLVRVSAPSSVGAEVLPRMFTQFAARHPEVEISLFLGNDADTSASRFDLMIRGGPQPDSAMVMRKLRDTSFRLFASPAYLLRAGMPTTPEALSEHECLLFNAHGSTARWHLQGPKGAVEIVVGGRLRSDGLSFLRRAAIEGAGIALIPGIAALHAVREGLLRPVLPEYQTESSPLLLVFPSQRHVPVHVRTLAEFLLASFPSEEQLDGKMFA